MPSYEPGTKHYVSHLYRDIDRRCYSLKWAISTVKTFKFAIIEYKQSRR